MAKFWSKFIFLAFIKKSKSLPKCKTPRQKAHEFLHLDYSGQSFIGIPKKYHILMQIWVLINNFRIARHLTEDTRDIW